jgi:hypothetical protein
MVPDGELVMRVNVEGFPETQALVATLREEGAFFRLVIAREITELEADARLFAKRGNSDGEEVALRVAARLREALK